MKDFYIWEGVFPDFQSAKNIADGFGFSGETYNMKAVEVAKECLDSLKMNKPIPLLHKQRSVLLPSVVSILLKNSASLRIFDFGGGLGIGYMVLKESIEDSVNKLSYTILELPEICKQGEKLHKGEINFISSFSVNEDFDLIHSSSAFQYIEDWEYLVKKLCSFNAKYILLSDVFAGEFKTYVTLQNYYNNKIPHWFFNYSDFVKVFEQHGYVLDMRTYVSAKRLNYDDELPMDNFEEHLKLKYTSHLLFSKKI